MDAGKANAACAGPIFSRDQRSGARLNAWDAAPYALCAAEIMKSRADSMMTRADHHQAGIGLIRVARSGPQMNY